MSLTFTINCWQQAKRPMYHISLDMTSSTKSIRILLNIVDLCCQVRGNIPPNDFSCSKQTVLAVLVCFYTARFGFSAAFLTVTLQFANFSEGWSSRGRQCWQYLYFYHWSDSTRACPEIYPEWGLPRLPSRWGEKITDCFTRRPQMWAGDWEILQLTMIQIEPLEVRESEWTTLNNSSSRRQRDGGGNSADREDFIPFNRWNIKYSDKKVFIKISKPAIHSLTMNTESQGTPWWKNLSSKAEGNSSNTPPLKTDEKDDDKTEKLLKSYRRIIEKNTELIRLLMTNFKAQAEELDKFMTM